MYKKLGLVASNLNPVVLDIGEAYTKLGFAGENEPRSVIPTAIQEIGKFMYWILQSEKTFFCYVRSLRLYLLYVLITI